MLGEHAVVYGAPALAIPVPRLTATASAALLDHPPSDTDEVAFTLTGPGSAPVTVNLPGGAANPGRRNTLAAAA
jgi:mevalonate kinase